MNWRKTIIVGTLALSMTAVSFAGSDRRVAGRHDSAPLAMPTPVDKPPFNSYRGIEIGTSTDDARKALGNPKEKSDTQDYFEFSDNESAQVYYDADHKVMAVSITYTGNIDGAPTPKAVFGEDAEVKPDGGIFKMERYPKAGFWISYTKTGGDGPMVIIALQKI